jgi:hypothetical protein
MTERDMEPELILSRDSLSQSTCTYYSLTSEPQADHDHILDLESIRVDP